MKNNLGFLTAGELAKIHQINKRTLHYYDEVGIFSPKIKGENNYRYYTFEQTMELENILSLRELGMSIEEIKSYMENPNPTSFNAIASSKIEEIDKTILRLKKLKADFIHKKNLLLRCEDIYHGKIELVQLPQRYLFLTEMPISFENSENLISNSPYILNHLRQAWKMSNYRRNCGSYISLDKVNRQDFKSYNGIFSEVDTTRKNLYISHKGRYLRGFCAGDWDNVPSVYEKMLEFAYANNITLSGFAFESGINEFAIKSENEYITQIEIRCAD